ncbi:MAG: radical SAM protein [bacterium]|nr:radical SAM protein [bacterium]
MPILCGKKKGKGQAIILCLIDMHITLVSPRIAVQKGDFLGSGIPYWPIEMAVLAAFLKLRGEKVSVIDLFGSSPTTLEERDDYYLQGRPFQHFIRTQEVVDADIVIVYALSYMSHKEILSIATAIKKHKPHATIAILENSQAVTGYALDYSAEEFFDAGANALLCGEVYWNWNEIIAFLKDPKGEPCENILAPNLSERKVNRKFNMKPSYPIPAWELFPLKNYWSIPYSHGPKTNRFFPMLTSRGCPFSCDFCVIPETNIRRWRPREPEEVVNEMIELRNLFSVYHFQIEDLNPTANTSQWNDICNLLIEKKAGVYFYFVSGTKAETIKLDKVPLYAKAGCRYISISPESGSKKVLKAIGKSFSHSHGELLVESCRKHGIYTQACFLVGHPTESEEDHNLSCDYLYSLIRKGLDEVAVFIIAPLAGSSLYKQKSIEFTSQNALISFSPKGRIGWKRLEARRCELIKVFLFEKLKKGGDLWLSAIRALVGMPRTKVENLPRRILFIYWLLLKYRLQGLLKKYVYRFW